MIGDLPYTDTVVVPGFSPVNVKIIFGEPVETAGMSREEQVKLPERIRGWISETYKENA